MIDILIILSVILSAAAAMFAFLAFQRAGRGISNETLAQQHQHLWTALRGELERVQKGSADDARLLRQELGVNLRGFQESTMSAFRDLGELLGNQVDEFGRRLDEGVKKIDERVSAIASKLDRDIARMGEEAGQSRDALRGTIESKLDDAAGKQAASAKESREEITASFRQLGSNVAETLERDAEQQRLRLEDMSKTLAALTEKNEKTQEALRQTVESRLDAIRNANDAKLDEMRKTVDERLQSTLETRLGQSFQLVSDQLQKVSMGLGEMQQLASGVGDLKRVLTQVKPRGIWGEVQLGSLLEDFLAADQFSRNVGVKSGSQERVEFAIKLPRLSDGHDPVFLPIDAKFPHEYFERVVSAAETADSVALEEAARELEKAIRIQAREIATKYIVPPTTTDYAIMFLPSESLYSEVARRPGLVEAMAREQAIMIAGPSTLTALLNAIKVGFRSALIHQQAGEISKLLQKVRSEFDKYGSAVQTVYNRATSTVKAISELQTRQNVMGKALKGVDLLTANTPIDAATKLLELETESLTSEAVEKGGGAGDGPTD
jgi:DNA recombination protein RmuC